MAREAVFQHLFGALPPLSFLLSALGLVAFPLGLFAEDIVWSAPEKRFCWTRFDPFADPTQPEATSMDAAESADREAVSETSSADLPAEVAPGVADGRRDEGAPNLEHRYLSRATRPLYPGVEASRLDRPAPRSPEGCEEDLRDLSDDLNPFKLKIHYDRRPGYIPDRGYVPTLDTRPKGLSLKSRALLELAEEEAYRQIRRHLKKRWREQYQEDLSMGHPFYHSRLARINHIGKDEKSFDPFNADHYYNETRNDALQRKGLEGEKEITLVEWGPLEIDDRGDINFDLRELFDGEWAQPKFLLTRPRLSTERRKKQKLDRPLFSGKQFRVSTHLKVNFNPFRALREHDVQDTITTYGGAVEIDFYSDILRRKLFTTELEAEVDRDGTWGVFFNIVLKGRR